jgi:type I restriction enzyme S subunit
MSEVVNIPQLRFPEFNGEWEEKALGVVATITTGSTPSTSNNEYYDGDVAFVSPADIQGNRIVRSTKTTITELGLSVVREIKKRSTLFVCIGSTIGKVSQAGVNCATNQQINALTAKNSFDNDFIYSLLEFKAPRIKLLAGVQAVPQINKSEFSRFKFTFPLLPEQQKIAAFLTAVDNKIEQLSKKQALLGEYKKGLMQQIFSQAIRFKADDGSDFPDWKENKVDEFMEVTRGQVLAVPEMRQVESEIFKYPVYSSQTKNNGLTGYYTDYLFEDCITWTTDGANAGDVNYRAGKFYCTNVCGVLRSKKGYANLCIAQILNSVSRRYVSYVGNPKLMNNVMEKIKISIPSSINEQTKIANFLSSVDSKIEEVGKQLDESKQFKKALLQKMFV